MGLILKVILILVGVVVLVVLAARWYLHLPKLSADKGSSVEEKQQKVAQWLAMLHEKGRFNGTLLIVKNNEIFFEQSYGYGDIDQKTPLDGDSSYNLASVSKQFTAMGVVLLVENGDIDLDAFVSGYIPDFPYSNVTVRHLLHHTSGLADYMRLSAKHWDSNKTLTNQDILDMLAQQQPALKFNPGEKFEYSNTGYALLALLVEKVSGQTFADYMQHSLFEPLGMSNTAVFNKLSAPETLNNRVFGIKGEKLNDLNHFDGVVGDGSVYSSAYDLVKWGRSLDNQEFVSEELFNQVFTPGMLTSGKQTDYGFGWLLPKPGVAEHSGGWVGFHTYLRKDFHKNDLIIVLDNGSNFVHSVIIHRKVADFVSGF